MVPLLQPDNTVRFAEVDKMVLIVCCTKGEGGGGNRRRQQSRTLTERTPYGIQDCDYRSRPCGVEKVFGSGFCTLLELTRVWGPAEHKRSGQEGEGWDDRD